MKQFEVGDSVWVEYINGKVYSGDIVSLHNTEKEGPLVTVLTHNWGFRTVSIDKCSYTKPKRSRKSLSAAKAKN